MSFSCAVGCSIWIHSDQSCRLLIRLWCGVIVDPAPGLPAYSLDAQRPHEAGFDAFITGISFICMANFLGESVSSSPHLPPPADAQKTMVPLPSKKKNKLLPYFGGKCISNLFGCLTLIQRSFRGLSEAEKVINIVTFRKSPESGHSVCDTRV